MRALGVPWLLMVIIAVGTAAAQVTYKRVKGNIQGDVLVLTVNRVVNYDEQPSVLSADACEEQCSFVSGCQGWTYCSAAGGCGGGCKAWHDANGPGRVGLSKACTPDGRYLPIRYDTTYGPTEAERAEWKPDPTVCTGDKWPQHTCTLKYNMTGVKVYGGDQAGWVSGTVTLPPRCAPPKGLDPMTAFECDACLKSADPAGCLDCSKQLFKDSCGWTRQAYWVRKRPSFIRWSRRETCLACLCYTKQGDAAARRRCYEATKSIGVSEGKDFTSWRDILSKAAAQCPNA